MIKLDVAPAIKTFRKLNRDLTGNEFNTSIARALNHTIRKTRTASSKEIRKFYNIRSKDVKRTMRIDRATLHDLESSLISIGRPLPIIAFKPRQTKKGVTVRIGSKRKRINKAFIATMKSGHTGVFARGHYKRGMSFLFRYKRVVPSGRNDLPITELKTVAVPTALANDVVVRNLGVQMGKDFPTRLEHELKRMRTSIQ